MNIQAVTSTLIAHLNSLTGSQGKGLAITSKGGYFLLVFGEMAGGEYERVMIDDRIGEAYYIRLKTGVVNESSPGNKRRGSCAATNQIQAQCRLVAMSHRLSIVELADSFRASLNSFKAPTIGSDPVRAGASVRATQYDFATIVLDETPESERDQVSGWEGAMQIIAIDFDLTYISESCPVTVEC